MNKPTEDAIAVLEHSTASTQTPVILCIDDDPQVVGVVQDYLDRYDVKVLPAYFGAQGIWLAAVEHPDVIITDLRMPQGDGTTVIETLRRNAKTAAVPIVVLTGRTDPSIDRQVRHLGAENCRSTFTICWRSCVAILRCGPSCRTSEKFVCRKRASG